VVVGVTGGLVGAGDRVEGNPEEGEERGPPRLGPGRGACHRTVRKDKGLDPTGMGVEPLFEGGGRTGRGGRGGNQCREGGEEAAPVGLHLVR